MEVVTHYQVRRGEVFLVGLDPTRGGEIRKTRPCLVISPDEVNQYLHTFIVAPLTTGAYPYPFRVPCRFSAKLGQVLLDQIRTVDRERLIRKLGRVSPATLHRSLSVLQEMFAV